MKGLKFYQLKNLSRRFKVRPWSTHPRFPVFRDRPVAALIHLPERLRHQRRRPASSSILALPTLSRELDADTAQLQWVIDAYTLVMAGLLLSVGSTGIDMAARLAERRACTLFHPLIVAASWIRPEGLIAARAAMGVGAAVIFPTTLALITNIFPDAVARAKAIGLWAAMVGVGVAAGPITRLAARRFAWGRCLR